MNTERFTTIVDYVKSIKPNWFITADEYIATSKDIQEVEQYIGGQLPSEYVYFSLNYNAGYFAFLNIYSLSLGSEWYLIDKNQENVNVIMPTGFVAFSDDETGGYYGFVKEGMNYSNEVYFFDSSEGREAKSTEECFFDFVINKGFQPDHFGLTLP